MRNAEQARGFTAAWIRMARSPAQAIATSILGALLAGCVAGPDFKRPEGPGIDRYTAAPMPLQTSSNPMALGRAQHFDTGAGVSAQWWRALGSERLDAWIEQAFLTSPTLASARATLRQAQETASAQAASIRYPRIDANVTAQRERLNPNMLGQPGDPREFNLYNAGIGGHYRFDLAGGNRRALEALAARADFRRHELDGARLALAANITAAAITRARLDSQIEATQAMALAQDEQVNLTRERLRLGNASPDDVLAIEVQVGQTRAALSSLHKQLEQSEHLLAVLAGQAPGAAKVPEFTLEDFALPADLPVVLPSELVRRRPDIQAAEALLHAANAEYGVAVASLYPQLDLSASLGSQTLTTGSLFGAGSSVWNLMAQLTQPLLDPGLPARKRASLAALDAASANYQGIVLDALRDVADVLRALDHDAQALTSLAAADAAVHASSVSMEHQYTLGTASYVQLLMARQQLQQSRIGLVSAQAQRLSDSAALYQAMGGG